VRCLKDWLKDRGTLKATDAHDALHQVRAFLEAHGSSRFQSLRGVGDEQQAVIRDRIGFKRYNVAREELEFLILPEAFRNEICKGFCYKAVLKELLQLGLLVRTEPEMTIKPRLPELGLVRVYCLRAAILQGDNS
jgi:putative DNA primase/helicase